MKAHRIALLLTLVLAAACGDSADTTTTTEAPAPTTATCADSPYRFLCTRQAVVTADQRNLTFGSAGELRQWWTRNWGQVPSIEPADTVVRLAKCARSTGTGVCLPTVIPRPRFCAPFPTSFADLVGTLSNRTVRDVITTLEADSPEEGLDEVARSRVCDFVDRMRKHTVEEVHADDFDLDEAYLDRSATALGQLAEDLDVAAWLRTQEADEVLRPVRAMADASALRAIPTRLCRAKFVWFPCG